jgi:bis(5'-nucleosidyl)-tetraphosphatase
MKREISAGVIVYRRDAATHEPLFLVLHYISGHWDFAKGKLEGEETKIDAAIRELEEETGITTIELQPGFEQSLSYIFRDRKGEMVEKEVTFFLGETGAENVTLSREHLYAKWLGYKDASKQLTYANARQILAQANRILQTQE